MLLASLVGLLQLSPDVHAVGGPPFVRGHVVNQPFDPSGDSAEVRGHATENLVLQLAGIMEAFKAGWSIDGGVEAFVEVVRDGVLEALEDLAVLVRAFDAEIRELWLVLGGKGGPVEDVAGGDGLDAKVGREGAEYTVEGVDEGVAGPGDEVLA